MDNGSSTRVVNELRDFVAGAVAGEQLPSTRALVARYQVSPVTVQKALRRLVDDGLVDSRPGVGSFVRPRLAFRSPDYAWQTGALRSPRPPARLSSTMRNPSPDMVSLHAGYPDPQLLPERLIRAALARAARGSAAVARPPVAGLPELQQWFAHELAGVMAPGISPPTASDTIVLPGSQSGLGSVFRALVGAGRPLLVESPTYWGAIAAAQQAGVGLVPVPSGPDGPDPSDVARAFRETGARAFYAQPNYANPTGVQWSRDRAEAILAVVREHAAFLVEDDWAHDFGITTQPRPVAAYDDSGHVVYLRSLTKSVSPGVRVAGLVARGPARERLLADRAAESMYVSGVLQAAALDVVTHPTWATHQRRVREQLKTRRDSLLGLLRTWAPTAVVDVVPPGGLNLWARLPEGFTAQEVVETCERAGVLIAAGDEWFPAEPTGAYVRLNYSGPDPSSFETGARTLGEALSTRVSVHPPRPQRFSTSSAATPEDGS